MKTTCVLFITGMLNIVYRLLLHEHMDPCFCCDIWIFYITGHT